jgi:YD repeat-containing protein
MGPGWRLSATTFSLESCTAGAGNGTSGYGYDANGNITSRTLEDGTVVTYTDDVARQVDGTVLLKWGENPQAFSRQPAPMSLGQRAFTYDDVSRLTGVLRGD